MCLGGRLRSVGMMVQQIARRDASVDVIRILAIVAVVAGHVWFDPAARLATYTWQVPVFFVLSGYLGTMSPGPLGAFVRRRARSLLLPYAAWLLIIGLLLGTIRQPLRLLEGGAGMPHGFTAFWFVTAFFVALVAAAVVERMPLAAQWAIALALVGAGWLAGPAIALVPLSAGIGSTCVVFVVAGRTLRRVRDLLPRPALTGVVMLVVAVGLVLSGASAPLDLKQGDFGTPVVSVVTALLISCGLILVARRAFANLGERAGSVVSRLALCGFAVVLTHAAVLYGMHKLGAASWIAFAVAIVVPWALAMVLLRTPLAPVLCGVPRGVPRSAGGGGDAHLEAHARDAGEARPHDLDRLGVLVDEHEAPAERRGDRARRA